MPDASKPARRSALEMVLRPGDHGAAAVGGPGVRLSERHPLSIVQIEARADGADSVADAAEALIGIRPSRAFNAATGDGRPRLLSTGPARWLVIEPESRDLHALLAGGLAASGAAVVDLSHGRTVLRLSGRDARTVLMKGTGIDLHPRAFAPDACAQTTLFGLAVLIDCRDDAPTYDVYVARGFAEHLWEALADAAAEYGLRVR